MHACLNQMNSHAILRNNIIIVSGITTYTLEEEKHEDDYSEFIAREIESQHFEVLL